MSTPVLCALSVVATPDEVGPGLQSPLRPRGPADRPPPGSQPSQTSSDLSPSPGLERSIHGPRPPPWLLPPTPGPAPASMSLAAATWGQTQSPHGTPEDGEEGGACTGQCGAPGPRQAQLGAPETGLPHRSVGGGRGGHAQAVHTVGQAADGAHFQHLEPRGGVSPRPPRTDRLRSCRGPCSQASWALGRPAPPRWTMLRTRPKSAPIPFRSRKQTDHTQPSSPGLLTEAAGLKTHGGEPPGGGARAAGPPRPHPGHAESRAFQGPLPGCGHRASLNRSAAGLQLPHHPDRGCSLVTPPHQSCCDSALITR